MKRYLLYLLMLMVGFGSLSLSAQTNTSTVAAGNQTNGYVPVYGFYADAYLRSQTIYPANMMADMVGGEIQSIQFYLASAPDDALTSVFAVKLSVVNQDAFTTNSFISSSATTVFTGPMSVAQDNTWTIAFATPFTYTGGNLMVEVVSQSKGNYSATTFYGITAVSASMQGYNYNNVSSIVPDHQDFIPKTTFTFTGGATCLTPTNPIVSDVAATTATLSWTPRTTSSFEVCINPVGSLDDATWMAVADTFYTFTGLTPGTMNTAYVRANCGSDYSGVTFADFYTSCDVVSTFPWFEGFENGWIPVSIFGQTHESPLCWSIYDGGTPSTAYIDYTWAISDSPEKVYEGNASAVCYTDFAIGSHNDWLISPMLDLSDNMLLSFYAQNANDYTDEQNEVSVWISDANAVLTAPANSEDPLPGFTQIYQSLIPVGGFMLHEVSLAGYSGNRYIAFVRRNQPDDGWYLCIDNVTVDNAPVCQRPVNLATVSTTTNTANLTWTTDAPQVNLYYRLSATDNYQMLEDVTLDADSVYELQGLLPGQEYEWYVEAICSDGTALAAIQTARLVTVCVSITTLPRSWDFETNNAGGTEEYPLPTCWDRVEMMMPYVIDNSGMNGSSCLLANSSSPVVVMLPEIDPAAFEINQLQLNFYAKNGNSAPSVIEVGVVTDPEDVTSFVVIDSITEIYSAYNEYIVPLNSYQGAAGRIAFRLYPGQSYSPWGTYTDYLYIDDLMLMELPVCPRPEMVTAVNTTASSVSLTWSSSESSFNVYYKPVGAVAFTAATESPIQTLDYTIQNLQPSTTYTIYVATVCVNGTEVASQFLTVTTPCAGLDTLPYFVDFESGYDPEIGLPYCWTRGALSTYEPNISSGFTYAGNNALFFSERNTVAMQAVDTSELTFSTMMLSFYAMSPYSDEATLQVGVMTDPANHLTFTQIGPDLTMTNAFQQYEVVLSSYTGSGVYPAFRLPVSYNTVVIDNVMLDQIPNCMRPTGVTPQMITTTTAGVVWNAEEDQSAWQVVIGPAGCDPTTLTPISVNVNNYLFENLTLGSSYDVYVRTDCGDEVSAWSSVCSFTTLLSNPAIVPFVCDFEDVSHHSEWTILNGTQVNQWVIDTAANNTVSGEYALYVSEDLGVTNSYSIDDASYVWAYRDIQFSDADEFELSFDYRCVGESNYDYLNVYIGSPANVVDGNGASPAGAQLLGMYMDQPDWTTATISLSGSYSNTVKRLYFLWRNDFSYGTNPPAAVDNISINTVSCARPTQLVVSNVGTVSAVLNIASVGNDSGFWEVMLNDTVFTVNSDVVDLVNLTPSTIYTVTARTICAAGDTSIWASPITFMTECQLISALPQTWDFETDLYGGTVDAPLPVCWNRSYINEYYPYACNYGNPHSGSYSLYFYNSYPNTIAVMPAIDDVLDINNLQVSFYARVSGESNATKLMVGVMTDPNNDATFTPVETLTLAPQYSIDPIIVMFDSYTGSGRYIAFKNYVMGSIYTYIDVDDVTLEEIPACPAPRDLAVSNITTTSATVTWTESGTATSWIVEYGEADFAPGSGTQVTVDSTTCNLTGLTMGTGYTVLVKADCDEDVSPSRTISFSTDMCEEADQCTYTFILTDTYGDGWNGGKLQVVQNDIVVATLEANDHSVSSGAVDTVLQNLCDNILTTLVWMPGSYAFEAGFTIIDPEGNELYTITDMTGYTNFTFTTDCSGDPGTDTCEVPTGITVSNITKDSFVVAWDNDSEVSGWNIQYRPMNGTLSSASSTTNSYLVTGLTPQTTYQVQVQAVCTNGQTSNWSDIVNVTTMPDGIGIHLFNSITLYPNPANEVVNVQCTMNNVQVEAVEVIDVYGKVIRTVVGANDYSPLQTTQINVSGLAMGMYFVRLTTDAGVITKTFVKR